MSLLGLYNQVNKALDQEDGAAKLPIHVLVYDWDNKPHLYKLEGKVLLTTDTATGERLAVIG